MEKYLFEFHRLAVRINAAVRVKYDNFLESKLFWSIALIMLPAYLLYYNVFFFSHSKLLFSIYLITTFILLSLLIPPIYYRLRGMDFFSLKQKYFQNKYPKPETILLKKKTIIPLNKEQIDALYITMSESNLLDPTLVLPDCDTDCFSKDYISQSLNSLKLAKQTDKSFYLTCDQKAAGYVIHEVFRPLLGIDTKILCDYFYYYKNDEFRKVNYQSINAIAKRKEIKQIKSRIPDILK